MVLQSSMNIFRNLSLYDSSVIFLFDKTDNSLISWNIKFKLTDRLKMKNLLTLSVCAAMVGMACTNAPETELPVKLKELKPVTVAGAVKFGSPELLMDDKGVEIYAEKFGRAYPLFYDWDNDGLKDLLVGEFGGGEQANIKVYRNVGTAESPKFSSEWFYATDKTGKNMYVMGS